MCSVNKQTFAKPILSPPPPKGGENTFLQHHGANLCLLADVTSFLDPIQSHRIPLIFYNRHIPLRLKIKSMILTHLDILVFLTYWTGNVKCSRLNIKICLFDGDGKRGADAGGSRAACYRFVLHFADSSGADSVVAFEEVVQVPGLETQPKMERVPHVFWFFGEEGY